MKADDLGDRNQWRAALPKLPTWKQKTKKHAGKRFGSRLAHGVEKKRKVEEKQTGDFSEQRVRFFSESEMSDQTRRVICVSEEGAGATVSSDPTLSAPELVSNVTVRSPAKLCTVKGEDDVALRELQELLDDPVPSGIKGGPAKSQPKVGMSAKGAKKTGLRSRIRDQRVYSCDEIIESREKLNDSNKFHFSIDNVEKEF